MIKRFGFFIVALLASTLIALIVAEAAARVWATVTGDDGQRRDDWQNQTQSMFTSHPTRSYAHTAHYHGYMHYRGQDFSIDLNALGIRTDAGQRQPPDSAAYTILGLGDSQTFGWGVEARDCYLARLERILVESTGTRVRALNAGVIGYGTDQEADVLRGLGPVLHPKIVIVGFFANDILACAMPKRIVRYGLLMSDHLAMKQIDLGPLRHHPAFSRRDEQLASMIRSPGAESDNSPASRRKTVGINPVLRHSVLYRLIVSRINEREWLSAWLIRLHLLNENRAAQYQRLTLLEFGLFLRAWPDLYEHGWDRTQDSLLQIAGRAKDMGAELLVLNIPYPFEVDEHLWHATAKRYHLDEQDFDVHKPSRLLSTFCETHRIRYLDLRPTLRQTDGAGRDNRVFFQRDSHLTERGHALIAQDLIRYLMAQHLLPQGR